MSGWSDVGTCPNCEGDKLEIVADTKPFNMESTYCYDCGFYTYTKVGIDSLKGLNEAREEASEWSDEKLKPLKKAKSQSEWAKQNMHHYITDKGEEMSDE